MKLKDNKDIHLYKWQRNNLDHNRKTKASLENFYTSKAWRKLREYHLSKQPLCQHCLIQNKYIKGYIVDHITPIQSKDDPLALDENNLMTLCSYHHNRKTRIDNSKYNPDNLLKGKEIQEDLNNFD